MRWRLIQGRHVDKRLARRLSGGTESEVWVMTAQEKIERGYRVKIKQLPDGKALYSVSYNPRELQQVRSGRAGKASEYIATVSAVDTDAAVTWSHEPVDPEAKIADFVKDARRRVALLHPWLVLLFDLITSVDEWAKSLDWATKKVDKPMEDTEIGAYTAAALVMQKDFTRILLEPVGRNAPGAEGVVDLYLMPGLDDVASLYYYRNRWNLHYMAPGSKPVGDIRETAAKPLTKVNLQMVLDEMRAHVE